MLVLPMVIYTLLLDLLCILTLIMAWGEDITVTYVTKV